MNLSQDARNPPELGANFAPNNQDDDELQISSQYIMPIIDRGLLNAHMQAMSRQEPIQFLPMVRANIMANNGDENFELLRRPPLRMVPIIPQINLENVGDIEIIENVEVDENIANVVEVPAVNDNNPQGMNLEIEEGLDVALPVLNLPLEGQALFPNEEPSTSSSSSSSMDSEVEKSNEDKPRKKRKLENEETKSKLQENEDNDEGRVCPICMEPWTNSGEHRLCSLACGHLFGHKCVLRWLKQECTSQNRRCPHCNTKAQTKDIRMIYTTNLTAVDTIELDRLRNELQNVIAKKKNLESELSTSHLRYKIVQDQMKGLVEKIKILETERHDFKMELKERSCELVGSIGKKFHLEKTLEIAKDGGCRVLDYNSWYSYLAVSQKSTNLFPGYGIKKIDMNKYEQMPLILAHSQAIRDMSFHKSEQSLLLSVSFDKTAKMIDIHNHQIVHTYPVDSQAWSCCWVGGNPNIFVVGTQKGITQFDIRRTSGPVQIFDNQPDRSPIVSLAPVPPASSDGMLRGGFLATHLNSCYAYELKGDSYVAKQMLHDGPFICVRYDSQNHHALISCRPNATTPQTRHIVFSIERGTEDDIVCNTAQTFFAGNNQNLLSRPCHINVANDTYIAAHRESNNTVPIWAVSTGKEIQSIPASNPIVDLCSFSLQNSVVLGALSANKLRIYNCEQP